MTKKTNLQKLLEAMMMNNAGPNFYGNPSFGGTGNYGMGGYTQLGHFGLKMISKIVFLLVLILMIGVFLVIQVVILTDSFISNIMRNGLAGLGNLGSTNTSNGTGYYLILAAVVLMIVNCVIYVFLA